jgi:hypothetical protein
MVENVTDLDAVLAASREGTGEDVRVKLSGEEWTLPPGLPLDVLAPLLPFVTELSEVIGPVIAKGSNAMGDDEFAAEFVSRLAQGLPTRLVAAFGECGRRLFDGPAIADPGTSQWARWLNSRPTTTHYRVLLVHLGKAWGVGLGELMRYWPSAPKDGPTSNGTSPPTPEDETPSTPGADLAIPAG